LVAEPNSWKIQTVQEGNKAYVFISVTILVHGWRKCLEIVSFMSEKV
jgi:hypothetical protein